MPQPRNIRLSLILLTLEKVIRAYTIICKRAHIIFSWTYITIPIFFNFRRENISQIINRNIKNPNILQAIV